MAEEQEEGRWGEGGGWWWWGDSGEDVGMEKDAAIDGSTDLGDNAGAEKVRGVGATACSEVGKNWDGAFGGAREWSEPERKFVLACGEGS